MLITPEALLKRFAKGRKEPEEQLRVIILDFWQQIMMYLQHPEDNYLKGILIENCCKFRINPKRVMLAVLSLRKNNRTYGDYYESVMINHEQLLINGQYTKKQEEITKDIERYIPYIT